MEIRVYGIHIQIIIRVDVRQKDDTIDTPKHANSLAHLEHVTKTQIYWEIYANGIHPIVMHMILVEIVRNFYLLRVHLYVDRKTFYKP